MTFTGAVLTGGASRRMGRDKSLLPVGGRPLAVIAASALEGAGAGTVYCVGGDAPALAALGLDTRPDRYPGEGPLGGLITALAASTDEVVMVLSCDLATVAAAGVTAVLDALADEPSAELAVPLADGRHQFLHGAYRRRSLPHWEAAFAAGERSVHRAAMALTGVEVVGLDPAWLHDVDTPGDCPATTGDRYARPEPTDHRGDHDVDLAVPEIDVDTLAQQREVPLIDVREVVEYTEFHVPGAQLIPLSVFADRVDEVPTDGRVFVICRSGGRSLRVAELLRSRGVDAVNVAGGSQAWLDAGRPVVSGIEPG